MNRKRAAAVVSLVMVFVLCFGAVSAYAITAKISVQVYKPANELILKPDVSGQIVTVNKYTITYKGRASWSTIEKLLKNVDGAQVSPDSMKWVSSNEKVATVNSHGTVTGVKKGKAYIYPVPRGVYSYKTRGKYIIYLTGNISNGFKLYGGIGAKVKVNKN